MTEKENEYEKIYCIMREFQSDEWAEKHRNIGKALENEEIYEDGEEIDAMVHQIEQRSLKNPGKGKYFG